MENSGVPALGVHQASPGVDIATSSFYQEKDAKVTGKNKDSCGKVDDGSFRARLLQCCSVLRVSAPGSMAICDIMKICKSGEPN